MAVVIRMTRQGQRNRPFYRIVAADRRYSRDGKFLEVVGTYDPKSGEASVKKESAEKWIKNGAEITATVKQVFKKQGVSLATK